MTRKALHVEAPILRLSVAEYHAIPVGRPVMLSDEEPGYRWREICWGGVRVRQFLGVTHDGLLIVTWRPVIRVPAVSRLVPRRVVTA